MQESVDDAIIAQDGGNDVQLTLEAWKPEGEAFFRFSNESLEKYSTWFYFTHGFWRYDGRPIFDFPRRAVLLDMVVEEETWLRPMDQMHEYAGAEDSEKKSAVGLFRDRQANDRVRQFGLKDEVGWRIVRIR